MTFCSTIALPEHHTPFVVVRVYVLADRSKWEEWEKREGDFQETVPVPIPKETKDRMQFRAFLVYIPYSDGLVSIYTRSLVMMPF